ncbi:DUF3426 domain-containing protein [Aromatoleum toluvorans]|uniref:DUF3426 domain-containing protein n=1 Tax=Aromatoleum toluvorans TaxID=92002 RepID=A0ABX1Q323_9RHOO|nr:zinc-ribbon and DUF3426 domain-containing protein [Aromatoleum toluvorans]NMG46048.1 DUF3426 domain-containing protein [Aromatoleum toluvorans]
MLARCPACHTVFRVRTEQLRAHRGQVRCGSCLLPFNALDHLIEEPSPPAAPETPELPPDRSDRFFVLDDKAEDALSHQLDFELPDTLLPQRAPVRDVAEPRQEPGERPPPPPMYPLAGEEDEGAATPSAAQRYPEPAAPVADEEQSEPAHRSKDDDTDAPAPGDQDAPWPQPEDRRASDSEEEPAPETLLPDLTPPDGTDTRIPSQPDVKRDFDAAESAPASTAPDDEFAAYAPPAPRSARRNLVGLGIGLLSGVLAAQSLFLFRADIAREWPLLRPALVKACAALSCTIALPRIASQISVESSDLQSEPGRAGRFVLNAMIRNRAPHPLAYPHLELTLTDARDRPLVRRVLAPQDWFPGADLEQGFAAGRDIAVTLPFVADGLGATGYRIYAFYP